MTSSRGKVKIIKCVYYLQTTITGDMVTICLNGVSFKNGKQENQKVTGCNWSAKQSGA